MRSLETKSDIRVLPASVSVKISKDALEITIPLEVLENLPRLDSGETLEQHQETDGADVCRPEKVEIDATDLKAPCSDPEQRVLKSKVPTESLGATNADKSGAKKFAAGDLFKENNMMAIMGAMGFLGIVIGFVYILIKGVPR